jgi:hypothetical protein
VALNLVLLSDERRAYWIPTADVYRTGVLFRVQLHAREPARPGVEQGAGTWRFGVQFADGRKATTFGLGVVGGAAVRALAGGLHGDVPPEGPLLVSRGGGGSRTLFRQDYWLWPLPPPGELVVATEWPNAGVELVMKSTSADVLREASGRARQLWPAGPR